MKVASAELSRAISHALRHEPWIYELELDVEGWVSLDQLLSALRRLGGDWTTVDREQVESMIRDSDKQRHELRGEFIRARYGHSVPGRLTRAMAAPPDILFHGTSPAAAEAILNTGLRPMGRQYVHLSADRETALAVGRRKHERPVILQVRAGEAYLAGTPFYRGNDRVWLADEVPAGFLTKP